MYDIFIGDMTILQEESTRRVTVMASTYTNSEILIGQTNGNIHLWRFLDMVRSYIDDNSPIVYIHSLSRTEFLSANKLGIIKIWDIDFCFIKQRFYISWWRPDYIVMLPDNLMAFSKYCGGKRFRQTIEVWDVNQGVCVHRGFHNCSRGKGMPLDTTVAGYLVVASTFGREMFIWDISRSKLNLLCKTEVDVVFSLAALPTNEIVTAARNIEIYKLTQNSDIFKIKVIEHKNVIDIIIPVAGYKFLTVDRSRNHSGVLKLWYCSSEKHDYLGHSKNTGTPKIVSSWYNLIFSYKEDKLFVKHYDSDKLKFPTNLAEIRKNVRLLAQAKRTSTSLFVTLPTELLINIAVLTADNMNHYERKVSQEFAWSHFCRPHYCDIFIKEKAYMRETFKKGSLNKC